MLGASSDSRADRSADSPAGELARRDPRQRMALHVQVEHVALQPQQRARQA